MISDDKAYRWLTLITLSVVGVGVVFYHEVEKLNWVDAYYYSVVTLTTVGYGDITPKTTAGKLFTTLYLVLGIGIITAFITTTVKRRGHKIVEKRHNKQENK